MKILVTGASGMLGSELCRELAGRYETIALDVRETKALGALPVKFIKSDITEHEQTIEEIVKVSPELIIHTAAYTDVDGCELNPEKAYRVNGDGTGTVAQAGRRCGASLIYISTDYVFDGQKQESYNESDSPNPLNVYGKSKLAGEEAVKDSLVKYFIVRTSWLFGKNGKNFVNSIIEKAGRQKRFYVVDDQVGSPTYARDLARGIEKLMSTTNTAYGIYHLTNSGSCSWYEFALKIIEYALIKDVQLEPVTSQDVERPAVRPKMSILDGSRYRDLTQQPLRLWQEALREYLANSRCIPPFVKGGLRGGLRGSGRISIKNNRRDLKE